MIKYTNKKMIDCSDWDNLVIETYGRPYEFQQQDGCKDRGTHTLIISDSDDYNDDYMPDSVPDVIDGNKMGVKFSAWLKRDPNEWNGEEEDRRFLNMFWARNFYPNVDMVANDLCKRGLIEPGEYIIDINW